MLDWLPSLRSELNLDSPWVAEQEFETLSDEELEPLPECEREPTWQCCLAWFMPFVKCALDAKAKALHLRSDHQDNCLLQFIYAPKPGHDRHYEWFELLTMPWPLLSAGSKTVRRLAWMMPWSKRGIIRYRYNGKRAKAYCVQESVDDLVIYFAEDRPAIRQL